MLGGLLLTGCLVVCAGCPPPPPAAAGPSALKPLAPPRYNGQPMSPVTGQAPQAAILFVRAQLISVAVPFGMASRSERLWRYLDEEIVDPTTMTVLSRNGFRVGRGRLEDWPSVAALLEEMAGRSLSRSLHSARPAIPMPIVLREKLGAQRIFTFDKRGELRGLDYPPGDNALTMTTHLNSEDQSGVLIQAVPVVRSSRKVQKIVKTDAGYAFQKTGAVAPVEQLEFVVKVPRDHYLVIGPGTAIDRNTSPGRHFLVDSEKGVRRETLLVIVPEVFAAEVRQEPE